MPILLSIALVDLFCALTAEVPGNLGVVFLGVISFTSTSITSSTFVIAPPRPRPESTLNCLKLLFLASSDPLLAGNLGLPSDGPLRLTSL